VAAQATRMPEKKEEKSVWSKWTGNVVKSLTQAKDNIAKGSKELMKKIDGTEIKQRVD
jgi:hypothetical protein